MSAQLLQACLNGARSRSEHAALPCEPDELAADAVRCWMAGASSVHVHPRDAAGEQTLAPGATAEAIAAIRAAQREVEVSVSTGAFIEPDPQRRVAAVMAWTVLPDVASVNFSEDGVEAVCGALNTRGIEIEAGLESVEDAERFVASGLAPWCRRVLVEVADAEPRAAVARAAAIDDVLDRGGLAIQRQHHGEGIATWAVLAAGVRARRSIRIGLEDTLQWPDGRPAPGNEALVIAAAELMRRAR